MLGLTLKASLGMNQTTGTRVSQVSLIHLPLFYFILLVVKMCFTAKLFNTHNQSRLQKFVIAFLFIELTKNMVV